MEGVGSAMGRDGRVSPRLIALSVAVALAFGVAACGSGDDDSGNGNEGANLSADSSSKGTAESGTTGSPQQQVKAAYDHYIDARRAKQYEQACAVFSASFRRQYPKYAGLGKSCVDSMRRELAGRPSNPESPKVVKVKLINNRVATGYVKTTPDSTTRSLIRFIRQDGTWKMDGAVKQG